MWLKERNKTEFRKRYTVFNLKDGQTSMDQNDKDKLVEAKELVYLKGFYEGTMLVEGVSIVRTGKKIYNPFARIVQH